MKVKVEYTKELADDVKQVFGIDIEKELEKILIDELVKEVGEEKAKEMLVITQVDQDKG